MYDTGGQERFNAINESYYRKADAILLIYDITQRNSFATIKEYYCPKIKDLCKVDIPIILLGNKADLEDKREVTIDEGAGLALERNLKFKETSCLKNENVADAFEALIELWNFENHKKKKEKKKEKGKGKKKEKEKEKKIERKNTEDFSKSSIKFVKENDDKEETDNKMRSSLCLNYLYTNKEDFNLEKEDNDNKNDFENEDGQRFALRPSDNLEPNKDSKQKKKKKKKCINA